MLLWHFYDFFKTLKFFTINSNFIFCLNFNGKKKLLAKICKKNYFNVKKFKNLK